MMKLPRWGIIAFAIPSTFIIFILALVTYVSLQDVQLVSDDYYEKGMDYQSRIDQSKNSLFLKGGVIITQNTLSKLLEIEIPAAVSKKQIEGKIRLIRPSDNNLDIVVSLAIDSLGHQSIDLSHLSLGLYRVEMQWEMDNVTYYKESRVVIH